MPWTEEPGRLQSMGSQRVGQDQVTNTLTFTFKPHSFTNLVSPHLWTTVIKLFIKSSGVEEQFFKAGAWCVSLGLEKQCAKSLQSCPTLCNSMNCNLPGSSVHGILQERILKWLPFPLPGKEIKLSISISPKTLYPRCDFVPGCREAELH